jgi:hypothetical protein
MEAGSGERNSDSRPGGTTVMAQGGAFPTALFFPTSVAILATNLLEAMPIEQGKESSLLIWD